MGKAASPTAPISIGCDAAPFKRGDDVSEILDAALSQGATTLDTARGYRHSEESIGKWMKERGCREKIYLVSKGCLPLPFPRVNPAALRRDLERSLTTLQTSYIDLYLLHRDQRKADMREIFTLLNQYRQEGKILAYGVSNWTVERVREINSMLQEMGFPKVVDISNNVSLLSWDKDPFGGGDGCVSFAGDEVSLSACAEDNCTIYAYSPLSRGMLTGRVSPDDPHISDKLDHYARKAYLSQKNLAKLKDLMQISENLGISLPAMSISYLTHLKTHVVPVIGMSNAKRIEENLSAAKLRPREEVMEEIASIVNR